MSPFDLKHKGAIFMILNLTQHSATLEQLFQGVVEPNDADKKMVQDLLTFGTMPDLKEIVGRAEKLADFAKRTGAEYALIGGAPYLMGALERELKEREVWPLYSFSERVSVEKTDPDGTVRKINEFRHKGFIEV